MNQHNQPALQMHGITKAFSGVRVLNHVDFELRQGEVMALMGENGAGKSTLMKILAGVYEEWSGEIRINDEPIRFGEPREAEQSGIGIIYQELNLVPNLSVAENIFLGREPTKAGGFVDFAEMNRQAQAVLVNLHFEQPVTRLVGDLRVGHQQLVEIAKALSLNAKILIMDEPTSALSDAEAEILLMVVRKLQQQGVSIIYISHRMAEIFDIADRITVLRDGANVGVVAVGKTTRQELIQLMVGRPFEQFFIKQSRPADEVVLCVKNVIRKDPDTGKRNRVSNISFDVKKGEIFGVAGLLGAGRTELLESLFGVAAADVSGKIELEGEIIELPDPIAAIDAGIALITEDRKGNGLVLSMNIAHNLSLAALNAIVKKGAFLSRMLEKQLVERYIDELTIDVSNLALPIDSLSGGNQQKVLLAKWLATSPRVLLLDDPTRGVDVGAKHDIYVLLSKLAQKGIAIVMTSSELPELLTICDRIMVLREGKISTTLDHDEATQEKIMEAAAPLG
jgi:ribose transport system ATP-binding protein